MKKKLIVFIVVIGVLFLFGIYKGCQATTNSKTVRIGAVLPLTGSLSFVGESAQKGMILAVDEYKSNNEAGNSVQLIVADGKSTAKDSIMAYRHLTTGQNLNALFCVATIGAKAISEQKPEMPFYMTIVSDSEIARNKPRWLNLTLNNEQEVDTILDYFKNSGKGRIAVVYQHDDLGVYTFETVTSRHDVIIVAGEEVSDESQVPSIVASICEKHPDAVFIAAVGNIAASIAKKLAEYRYAGSIASFSGFNTPSVLKHAGDAANGILICITQYDIGNTNEVSSFKQLYLKKYDAQPDFIAAYAYSLMSIYLTSGVDAQNYHTLFGDLEKASDGTIRFPLKIAQLKNGKVHVVE